MNAVQKLRQMVGELRAPSSPKKADEGWALVQRLLGRMPVDPGPVNKACDARDIEALDTIVKHLEMPVAAVTADESIPEAELEHALRAFKKRLKVMRLADESKLGGRQLTGGRKSEIDAIIPPSEFPREVWVALAVRGQLRDSGGGFYALR
jgi:hypothetical protein